MARRVKTGDMVQVICGRYNGETGRIKEVLVAQNRVRVEGLAKVKRHVKPGKDPKNQEGGIIEKLGSIHISNVMPIDPESRKPTRVSFKFKDGRKVRVAQRSGAELL